jgi:hypothetical protein
MQEISYQLLLELNRAFRNPDQLNALIRLDHANTLFPYRKPQPPIHEDCLPLPNNDHEIDDSQKHNPSVQEQRKLQQQWPLRLSRGAPGI